jgi:16S rRNA (cytosine1407-C5)-methyltransferase
MGKKKVEAQSHTVDAYDWAKTYLSAREFTELLDSLQIEIPTSVRINCLKSNPSALIEQLSNRYGWETEAVPFCNSGFWVRGGASAASSTLEHRMGYYYIQEAASMLPAELFDLDSIPEPLILDMAASPGGKTIHLIDRTGDAGLVIANDASRSRIPALRIVLENWGAIKQGVTCQQGEWFGYALPDTFDAVLLDAPCSMQGLRSSVSHTSRPISQNEISALAERQVNMLVSALQSVKTGGEVVYSTCTLSPQENEGVLSAVLERYPQSIVMIDIQERLPKPANGIDHIDGKPLAKEIQRTARLWPHIFDTAGFFCAKLIKTAPIATPEAGNRQTKQNNKRTFINDDDAERIGQQIEKQYGFDLPGLMRRQGLGVAMVGGNHFLVAKDLMGVQENMALDSLGMPLGKTLPESWQPSHALVSRFGDQFTRNIFILDDAHLAQWERGEDIRGVSSAHIPTGTVVAMRDTAGRNLGRGKILKDRIKNQLPTRLF